MKLTEQEELIAQAALHIAIRQYRDIANIARRLGQEPLAKQFDTQAMMALALAERIENEGDAS